MSTQDTGDLAGLDARLLQEALRRACIRLGMAADREAVMATIQEAAARGTCDMYGLVSAALRASSSPAPEKRRVA